MGGGVGFTPLSKLVLTTLLAIYVLQQVAQQWLKLPVIETLAWWPYGAGFQPWQPLTGWLLNGDVLRAFFDWLFLFFLLPPVEQMFSRKQLIRLTGFIVVGSAIMGLLLVTFGAVSIRTPWYGIEPLLAGLLVLFGLSRPNAQILLFFVLPVKASWVAYGSGLLCLLYLLSGRDLSSAMWAAGWLSAYLWMNGGVSRGLKKTWLKYKHQQLQRRLSRFDVIEGGRDQGWTPPGDDDNVH
jgi:membrane associated rhomboid family serine protease